MAWTNLHARMLKQAFEKVLGRPDLGSVAFTRCILPEVLLPLATDESFAPSGWKVWRVAEREEDKTRTITADRAVELRETKAAPFLLLVDVTKAGAGMDGIYSAAREIDEHALFTEAIRLAANEVTRQLSAKHRAYAERAIQHARRGRRFSISRWTEFDFFCSVADQKKYPGELLHVLGLWPARESAESSSDIEIDNSRLFVDRLLGATVSGLTPARRIETLRLLNPSASQIRELEAFLRSASTKPLIPALAELADKKELWVNSLQVERAAESIQSIELSSWRTSAGRIVKWSGLSEEHEDEPPLLILNPDADKTGDYSRLEVRWRARPESLEKGAVEYRVAILTEMDEELASKEVTHTGNREQKCRFTNDDFTTLSEDALISAKVLVSVLANENVQSQESEEFVVRFGQPPEREYGGVGKKVRAFSEGLIELESRDALSSLSSTVGTLNTDSKGFVLLRTSKRGKSYRVFRPPLIHEVENQWFERGGAIGRWTVKVRASGARAAAPEFITLTRDDSVSQSIWDRVSAASRRMSERFQSWGGGVGQVYNDQTKDFDVVKDYLLGWAALVEEGPPAIALANTVEVQSLSGRTIGIIVLPSHPLRVAWLVAYDNLVLHAAFQQNGSAKDIREEFATLDGAMFPAFLPSSEPF